MADENNYGFAGNLSNEAELVSTPVNFTRLRESVSQPSVMVPQGLSREQLREFILSHAK
jgi:hypothetical protein